LHAEQGGDLDVGFSLGEPVEDLGLAGGKAGVAEDAGLEFPACDRGGGRGETAGIGEVRLRKSEDVALADGEVRAAAALEAEEEDGAVVGRNVDGAVVVEAEKAEAFLVDVEVAELPG